MQDHQVQRRFQKLQQGVALEDHVRGMLGRPRGVGIDFPQCRAQQRHTFGKKTLLRSQPKRSSSTSRQESSAVGARVCAFLPIDGTNMLIRRAIAVLSILRADSMAVLRDLAGNPVRFGERSYQVTDQLGLTDAPRMPAHDNDSPVPFARQHKPSLLSVPLTSLYFRL